MIPVDGHKGFFRDEKSNAIINCNSYEYEQYLKLKSEKLKEKNEIDKLKSDIEEIKSVLNFIVQKINN